jgi:cell division septation protein DedD
VTAPPAQQGRFAIQVAALNDPARARELVERLRSAGHPSYLVEPPAADPDAPYKVRVGHYPTRSAAEPTLRALEKERGEKLWIVREVTGR